MLKKPEKTRLRKPPVKLKEVKGQWDEAMEAQLPVFPLATGVTGQQRDPKLAYNTAPARF